MQSIQRALSKGLTVAFSGLVFAGCGFLPPKVTVPEVDRSPPEFELELSFFDRDLGQFIEVTAEPGGQSFRQINLGQTQERFSVLGAGKDEQSGIRSVSLRSYVEARDPEHHPCDVQTHEQLITSGPSSPVEWWILTHGVSLRGDETPRRYRFHEATSTNNLGGQSAPVEIEVRFEGYVPPGEDPDCGDQPQPSNRIWAIYSTEADYRTGSVFLDLAYVLTLIEPGREDGGDRGPIEARRSVEWIGDDICWQEPLQHHGCGGSVNVTHEIGARLQNGTWRVSVVESGTGHQASCPVVIREGRGLRIRFFDNRDTCTT